VKRFAGLAAVVVAALLGTVVLASPVAAHSVLLSTVPATAGNVASAPAAVVLNFNEQPQGRFSTIHVTGPDGQRRDSGPVRVVNDAVSESLGGTRPAGTYIVDWRVISADGHPVSGQFSFTAAAAGTALAARQVVDTTTKSSSNSTAIIVIVVVVVVLVLVGLFLFLRRRKRPQADARSSFS
jgi:methionine-rich copper-binding protein CopC